MNRKMRRTKEKREKSPGKVLNRDKMLLELTVDKYTDSAMRRAELIVGKNYHLLWMLVLHDRFGFGHDRLLRCFKEVEKLALDKLDGYLDFEDIEETLAKECKLEFGSVANAAKK